MVELTVIIGASLVVSFIFIGLIYRFKSQEGYEQLEAMFKDAFEQEFKDNDNDE